MTTTKKILVVCPNPEGYAPGQRLKYEQYFDHWRSNGFEVTVRSFISVPFQKIIYKRGYLSQKILFTLLGYVYRFLLIFSIKKYDITYIFLNVTPFGTTLFEWIYYKLSKRLIYDIDDLVFLKPKSEVNKLTFLLKSGDKPVFLMKRAHHVITCTPYLDEFVRKYNTNTTDISSTINTETYLPVNSYIQEKIITLGWSGSHSTSKYLQLLRPVLLELKKTHSFKLLVIGDSSFEMEGIDLESRAWNAEEEVQQLQRIDIGLYPLPLEDNWVMGKSGLKALQYMALGIPTIATAIGANFRVINNEHDGFLVTTKAEWLSALTSLIENPDLRKKIGIAARLKVETTYSINANKSKYLEILNKVG